MPVIGRSTPSPEVSIENFLRQRGVNIIVGGSYTVPHWYDPQGKPRTFACRTTRVSPFRMMVEVPVVGKIGDRLTSHFPDLGRFDGCIGDTTAGGFLIELDMNGAMREQFANKLAWLEKKKKNPGLKNLRKDARIVPVSPHSTLTLADGAVHPCFIINMSSSGVAVSAQLQPPLRTPLAVGACVGRVIRLLSNGFAVKFAETLNRRDDLNRLLVRHCR